MTFQPNSPMVIDVNPKGGLLIRCPLWANDLVRTLPARKWQAGSRAWAAPLLKQNVAALRELAKMGGVQVTPDAQAALDGFEQTIRDLGVRNAGFPAWYRFKTEPRKHQREALNKLYGLKAAALFMDMQTGKSKTAIDLTACRHMENKNNGTLILVKRTLRRNWRDQFDFHCPLPFSFYLPDTDNVKQMERWLRHDHPFKIAAVGWESLSQGKMIDLCKMFMESGKMDVIGDEITYITGHDGLRSTRSVELARMGQAVMGLTGTPAEEGPMNLYMEFEFLDPNIIGIGNYYAFRNRYAVMGGYEREVAPGKKVPTKIVGYQNMDELMAMIAPFTFQVKKKDAYDLPPKRYERRDIELLPRQYEVLKTIKKDGILRLSKDPEAPPDHVLENVLEIMLRMHQVTGGYAVKPRETYRVKKSGEKVLKIEYDTVELIPPKKNPKMMEVCSIVEEMGTKQGIVWAVYKPELEALAKLLRSMGKKVGELHGGVPDIERQPMVNEFAKGGYDIVVANASTGGMGYTMMASEVNIFYNNTFKMIDRTQAEDRAWGDGQTKSGIWIDVIGERSVDIVIKRALEDKKDVADYVDARIADVIKLLDGELT